MNVFALFPLLVTFAYLPLLIASITSRPMTRQQALFVGCLIMAMLWSTTDYVFRSDFAPGYRVLMLQFGVLFCAATAVQYHVFATTFYSPGQRRWLPFAYGSLVVAFFAIFFGGAVRSVTAIGDKLFPEFGPGMALVAVPLLVLVGRNVFVFSRKLRHPDNPALYNQMFSLLLGLTALVIFTPAILLPWGRELSLSHVGSLINAIVLSYAVMRQKLLDIKWVLGRGLALISLVVVGVVSYFLLLLVLHVFFDYDFNIAAMSVAAGVAIVAAALIYQLHGFLFVTLERAIQGDTYDHRLRLSGFAGKIHNVFSLREQGAELLNLVIRALNCRRACLLMPGVEVGSFTAQIVEPALNQQNLANFALTSSSPVLQYLRRTRKTLTRDEIAVLPELNGAWEAEKESIRSLGIEVFVPLISRERLIGILVLSGKQSGRYSLEDFDLLDDVSNRVAVSIEKEYLREQLREREEELSVINRSSMIITSSLNVESIFDNFIAELKKTVDVDWAAISLIEDGEVRLLASSSGTQALALRQRIPLGGTAAEWVARYGKTIIESDLVRRSNFVTGEHLRTLGVRTIAYLPLIVKGAVIGTMTVASVRPEAYNRRQVKLLEQLASQIAMPIQNSLLYAAAEKKARVDDLTGLLNRRSLDEAIASEISRHTRYGGIFSLMILDLDSFKMVNDVYGHLAGDQLFRELAVVLKGAIRSTDQAFRYGGDEFAILLPETPLEAAGQVAERIVAQVPLNLKIEAKAITVSLGLATWPADGAGQTEIFAAADNALYEAKRRGGNRFVRSADGVSPTVRPSAADNRRHNEEIMNTIFVLAATVDARESFTGSHARRVNEYALLLGAAVQLSPQESKRLGTCATLHDVGKVGISDDILSKAGGLSEAEWREVKTHPQLGATIVGHAPALTPCVPGILYHHERYDGSGYPGGLKGEAIPLEARILAIADAFVVMTSERLYGSPPVSTEQALQELERGAGKQFDPALVSAFVSVVKKRNASGAAAGHGSLTIL